MELTMTNDLFFRNHRREIKKQHKSLLAYIYNWISSSNPPISKYLNRRKYYLINYNYLAKVFNTNYMNIRNYIKRLCGDKTSNLNFFTKKLSKGKDGHTLAWLSVNKSLAKQALLEDTYFKLFPKDKKMTLALFEDESTKIEYPEEAIAITNNVLKKYSCYFKNKIPSPNATPTKTYLDALRKVTDIFNGSFANPHVYSLNEKFNNNKQFVVKSWREKIKEVKGDWSKVRQLILSSLKNFDKMHLPMYLPFSKEYLQTNFSLWLFDNWEGQSQFVQCLEEPWEVKTLLSEDKADRIFKRLPESVRKAGNRFFDMNNDIGQVALWKGVEDIMLWAKELYKHDYGARYWADSYKDIPLKFQEWCKEHDIDISSSTLNMEKAIKTNAPWKWFLSEAIEKHGINKKILKTYTPEQVKKVYDDSFASSIPF